MQHATGELENTAGLRTAKRDLARALTVARQRGVDPNCRRPMADEETPRERRGGGRGAGRRDDRGGAEAPAEAEARRRRRRAPRGRDAAPRAQRRRARGPRRKPAAGPRTLEERLAERARAPRAQRRASAARYRAKQKAKRAEARAGRAGARSTHAPEHGPGRPKVRQGVVVSDKARQDDHRARRHRAPPRALPQDPAQLDHAARPRREQRRPCGRHGARPGVPADVAHQALAPARGPGARASDPERDPAARGRQHRRARDPHASA